ncbi:MAG: family rane protein [Aeromicrobium sp.]|nr:family rane protein [Aeromicrobium sp.]
MNPRRLLAPVVLATLATGGLAFFAASRTWASARVAAEGLPTDSVEVTGSDGTPLASALAVVVVASALAVLAASPRLRRGVGVFTALVALAAVWVIATGGDGVDRAVRDAIKESPSFTGASSRAGIDRTAWHVVAMAAFALAAALGAVTARFGGRWPSMGSRYDAPAAHQSQATPESDTDFWKAMDEGRDPTQ